MTPFQEMLARLAQEESSGLFLGSATAPLLSYASLTSAARRQAGFLRGRVKSGERVLIVGGNGQAQVEALLACWWAGCVPVCLPPPARLMPGMVYEQSLEDWGRVTEAVLGLAEPEFLDRCATLRLKGGWLPLPLETGDSVDFLECGQSTMAYVQFSSGTTRAPKAVSLSHGNLAHNITALLGQVLIPGVGRHSCVSWLPLYHDMGLIGSLLAAMGAPGSLTLLRPYQFAARPHLWLEALTQSKATISPAPNFALMQCLERVPESMLSSFDLSHWKMALLGSETVRPDTLRQFYARYSVCGLSWEALTPVYGLAEATLAVTFSPPGRGPLIYQKEGRESISVGRALPGVELRVSPEGHVLTRSPSVMLGYLGFPPLNPDDWLDTGDLGFLEEGELYLTGRGKDILILHGRNYDPAGFEEPLAQVEGLDPGRAAAVGVPGGGGSETVVVIAERRRRESLEAEQQREAARGAIARQTGVPACVHLVEAGWLPRTTSGKVRRGAARERFLEERECSTLT